jgi:hypothetical protein
MIIQLVKILSAFMGHEGSSWRSLKSPPVECSQNFHTLTIMNSFLTSVLQMLYEESLTNLRLISTTPRIHESTAFYNFHVTGIEVTMSKGSTTAFHECIALEKCMNSCLAK